MTKKHKRKWTAIFHHDDDSKISLFSMPKNKVNYNEPYVTLWQNESLAIELGKNRRKYGLGANDLIIKDVLLSRMDYGNIVRVNQSALARDIDMSPQMVYKSIKKLCKIGFIEKIEDPHGYPYYKVHPGYAFKGVLKQGIDNKKQRDDVLAKAV